MEGHWDAGNADQSINEEMSIIQLQLTETEDGQRLNTPLALAEWISLLVSVITSLEIVSSLFQRGGVLASMDFQIQMITLQPTRVHKAPWKPVVERALMADAPLWHDEELEDVLTTLTKCVEEGKEEAKGFTIFHHFGVEVMKVTGNVHCEAALPCLVKHLSGLVAKEGKTFQFNVKPI